MVPSAAMPKPSGRPVAEKVYGPPTPPLAAIFTGAIGIPCTALMTTQSALTGGFTVTEQSKVPELPAPSFTVTEYLNVPLTAGVPEMVPAADIVSPAGRPVAENV